ncbi:DUF3427 domain-containing protein [Brachymonas denitrificans]|uniref:DUF3427 domain-containing protein n=1 Tax=Brachymonas denitrificans TaxID=28220 RepID=UPI001BCB3F26|nr:DUF3427 domain-containing protein [Brachymonas denitrificans]
MVSFARIVPNQHYSRKELASLWGYRSYQAIARGVVTPKGDNKIILFVTQDKQSSSEQYRDYLVGAVLHWEGPNDHFAEERMQCAQRQGDEIHLFYREKHHSDFVYMGQVDVVGCTLLTGRPSRFELQLRAAE